MRTGVVLFHRDLRVHDHPALALACAEADQVVPLFVLDDGILASDYARPNRLSFLLEALADLRSSLRDLGATLVVRRGDSVEEAAALATQVNATAVFLSADVSGYAQRRQERLRERLQSNGVELRAFPGITAVPPEDLTTSGGKHYEVFTPYWRQWRQVHMRPVEDTPRRVVFSAGVDEGDIPVLGDLTHEPASPELPEGGERAGRRCLDAWVAGPIDDYDERNDDLAADATSRLSPYLHFGCLSPREIVEQADGRGPGGQAFIRQVCWREFHHQVLAARPAASWEDYRALGDRWRGGRQAEEALEAWKAGRTGYPIVDAGMRQLSREGWLHNRARLTVASFLVRDLYVDWRRGARHFLDLLVDGDIANNQMNWQWVVGTGTTSRRNRTFNPLRQADRFDPDGDYVRRYVPELAGIPGRAVHRPWKLPDDVRAAIDYPEPIVDHDEAMARFTDARGLG